MSVTTPPFQVAQHKASGSMGSAPIMLAASDLQLLCRYTQTVRVQICPLLTQNHSVFTTSTGEKLTASHVGKIVKEVLDGSASQLRKALAGRVSEFCCYFSICLKYIYTHIYIFSLQLTNPA